MVRPSLFQSRGPPHTNHNRPYSPPWSRSLAPPPRHSDDDRSINTDEEEEETETTVDCKDDCGLCEEDQETETAKDEPHDACDLCLKPENCASAAAGKKHHRRKRTSVILFDNEFPELTMEFSPSAFFGQQ